jgi:eukaryotic-like serine/threonine-protein kinase
MRPPQDTSSQPSPSTSAELAGVVERFEDAWQQAPPEPDLGAFLPPAGGERRRALVELAHIDLEYRLKAGQAARVEDYLGRFPELAGDETALSDLIAAEHRLRVRGEPGLGATEYLERFPQCREAILARLTSTASVPSTVRTSPPASVPPTRDPPPPPDTDAPAAPPLPASAGRYRLETEIGRGGMGEVLRARDPHLNRELAVKVLCGDGHPELLRRFVEEAQVCSQLQHPGIVPVYDLGTLPDGRPFFAMKLVKGRTLAELLKERRAPSDGLPHLLAVFEQVCQAVGYAHSRGVIHRDLKPANVMVGAFGEVQVMDWGLAKVLRPQGGAATEEAAVSVVRTVRSAAGEGSRDGQAMGTPAYMAPEQARGKVDLLDERCDVFGLGAILCELLTGRPPFPGRWPEAHARAVCADLGDAFARLDGCGADAELVGLAKRCLAVEAAARPRDAGAVAAAVAAHRESVRERLREAELGRAAQQARAEEAQARARVERRARRLTAALAAAVLLAAAAGLWLQRQRADRQAEAARQAEVLRRDVGAALDQAARFRRGGHFPEALGLLGQARQRVGEGGPDDLRGDVERALADAELVGKLDTARLRAYTFAGEGLDRAGGERAYAAAFAGSGLGREGEGPEAVAARVRASAVREEVVAALDDWAGLAGPTPRREWLLAVARAADPDPYRDSLRQPALWRDRAALLRLAGEARPAGLSPQMAGVLGWALLANGGDPVPLLRGALVRHPGDFWLNLELGVVLHQAKGWDEAITCYRVALALRPQAGAVHNDFGNALQAKGQVDEAVRHYEEALRLDPKLAPAHSNLGVALEKQGKADEALGHYEEALRLDPKGPLAHNNLGVALKARGRAEEAVRHYEEALRLDPKYASAHNNLGTALQAKGKLGEAIRHYEEALRLDPKYAHAHYNLGVALQTRGKVAEAIRHYQEAIRLNPKDALAHYNLGVALHGSGRVDEAIRHYEEVLRLDPRHPSAHNNLGVALKARGRSKEAVAHYEEALRLDPKLASAHNNLGNALYDDGRLDEAIRHYEAALRLDPKYAQAHQNLGNALYQKGRAEEAVRHYEEALRLDPTYAQARATLSRALLALGRWAEARDAARRGLDLLPARHPLRPTVARLLQRCERMLALEARLPAVLQGKGRPAGAAERLDFAALCQATQRHTAAARFYADAFAADPQLADDLRAGRRYNAACSAALAAEGRGTDAPKPDDKERARLRGQALGWLRADLSAWAKATDRALVRRTLTRWQQDADLAGVRGKKALAALPAEERAEWEKLWAEVADLLRRTDGPSAGAAQVGK